MMKIRSRIHAAAVAGICLLYLCGGSIATAATILPPGEITFFDNNGLPLSAGCVYFYVPGTTTPKTTYQNSGQTVANTNPVELDAAGRAIIYGTGTFRQVVKASGGGILPCSPAGAQVWDQLTASTDSSATIFAGASAGTPNAITVTAPAFSGTDGQVINYISTNTNTGGATFNPSGFGAVQIVRDSATGPGALTGGELVATNAVSLIYDATAGTFHILSPVTWPNTSGVAVGSVVPFPGFTAPTNYAFAYGQAVSRTSFSGLLSAYTSAQTGSLSSGSPIITGLSDTTQFARGQAVEAVGISAGATLLSCTSTTCTISSNATATRSGTVTFFAHGNGDGSTTFNIPNYNGRALVGRDNQGGTASNVSQVTANLTTTISSATATVSSATGLTVGMSIVGNANVPSGTTISTILNTTITMSAVATASQSNVSTRFSVFPDAQGLGVVGGVMVGSIAQVHFPSAVTLTGTAAGQALPQINIDTVGPIGASQPYLLQSSHAGSAVGANSFFGAGGFTTSGSASVSLGGSGNPFPVVSPASVTNYIVRLTP